jgi:hypothetical protein
MKGNCPKRTVIFHLRSGGSPDHSWLVTLVWVVIVPVRAWGVMGALPDALHQAFRNQRLAKFLAELGLVAV